MTRSRIRAPRGGGLRALTAAAWGRLSLRQAEVLQRSASDPASDIRFDDQFEYIDVVKVHLILFNFSYRSGGAEIPLLANNLFKCAAAIRRPPQNELLCTPDFVFLKIKGDAFEALRVIEDQTDRLAPRRGRPPASLISATKGRLDRIVLVFRRDLDHGCTLEVQPTSPESPRTFCGRGNEALSHRTSLLFSNDTWEQTDPDPRRRRSTRKGCGTFVHVVFVRVGLPEVQRGAVSGRRGAGRSRQRARSLSSSHSLVVARVMSVAVGKILHFICRSRSSSSWCSRWWFPFLLAYSK
jgi:hypothetical protein